MGENYAQKFLNGKLAMLRNRVGMVQGQVAESLNVSLTTVNNWETGVARPSAKNLQKVIALYLEKGGFTAGKEREEAGQLWDESLVKARFDDEWFQQRFVLRSLRITEEQTTVNKADLLLARSRESFVPDAAPQVPIIQDGGGMITEEPKQAEFVSKDKSGPIEYTRADRWQVETRVDTISQPWERQRLLEINSSWIQSCLLQTLLHTVHLQLNLRFLSNDVVASAPLHMLNVEQPERIISSSAIAHAYDEMGGTILILGEPGSGKTFLLLELARTLLRRAYEDEKHPIPVVLHLSSWSEKHLPLSQWIVEALGERYQIPREIGTAWVASEQLLPLLDGFDEVPAPLRAACIGEINAFRRNYGLLPLVVSARSTEYLAQEERFLLRGGIEILPLTPQHVEYYLSQVATQSNRGYFDEISTSIQHDTQLQELVSTPLMLSVLAKTYREHPDDLLQADTIEIVRKNVFTCYIDSMLHYRSKKKTTYYQPERVQGWLSWLAQQMEQRNQSEFYLEHIQIDWLPPGRLRRFFPIIGVGCVYALFLGIIKGVNYAFLQGKDQYGRSFGPARGLVDGLIIGACCLLTFVVLNGLLLRGRQVQDGNQHHWWRYRRNPFVNKIVYGALSGLAIGVVIGICVDIPAGIYNGLFCGVLFGIIGPLDMQIKPVEALFWSWPTAPNKSLRFVGLGVLLGVLYGLLTALYWQFFQVPRVPLFSRFLPCLLFGLSVGLILDLFVLIMRSTSHRMMDKPNKPNQGILNSVRNSLMLGGSSWLLFGTCFGIAYGILLPVIFRMFGILPAEYNHYFPKDTGVVIGLVNGLAMGAFFWERNGGTACTLHFVLRLLLWQAGCIPWRYSRFLDYAAEQVLLRKGGSCYMFIHRLLLEHFVELRSGGS